MSVFCWSARAQEQGRVDVVFDLDWTLINPTTEAMARAVPDGVFESEGKLVRWSDRTFEVLAELASRPDVRISFFSGGRKERNDRVVALIVGELSRRGVDFAPYKVLSAPDLRTVSTDESLSFARRFKKDLAPFFNLDSTVLVDDMSAFSVPGQERNMLWLGRTYNDRPRFDLVGLEDPAESKFAAPDEAEWRRDREKLVIAKDKILEALRERRRTGRSFADAFAACCHHVIRSCSKVFAP